MTLPDHGRDCLDDLVRPQMIEITVSHCEGRVAKLPLNDADIDPHPCQFASTRVSKPMNVDAPVYAPEYRVASGKFAHVAGIEATALVACEQEALCIVGPGGYPIVKLPRCLSVDPDYPALASLTLEYGNGSVFRINVAHPKSEYLTAPQLCAQCKQEDAAIASAANAALRERSEKAV